MTVQATSKKQVAAALFVEMTKNGAKRVDIINAMVAKANMTFSGASTYYQNFKSGAWDTAPKVDGHIDYKSGVDFDSMDDEEVLAWFNEHAGLNIAGFADREEMMSVINRFM